MTDSQASQLLARDPRFAAIVADSDELVPDPRLHRSVFDALSRAIVYQQLSGKAAGSIHQRFVQQFGNGHCPSAPRVCEADLEALRECGLSRPKAAYIQGLATAHLKRQLPSFNTLTHWSDERIITTLTAHKGVGVWTVQMLLIFWLGRPDILPADDLGIQKGLQRLLQSPSLPLPADVRSAGERWQPYRSLASWYLWRLSE